VTDEAKTLTPKIIAALAAVYFIWGSTYLAIKVTLQDLTPFLMASSRFLIAGALLYAFALWRGDLPPTAKQWRSTWLTGALLLLVGHGGVVFAQQWVPSSLAALAVASMPIWATVFSALRGRPSTRIELAAVAAGFVGVVLLNHDGGILNAGVGAIALLVAPIAWAIGSMLARDLDLPKGFMLSATQMLAGGVLLGVAAVIHGEPWPTQFTTWPLLAWLWQIFAGSIVAYTAYFYLLEKVRPALATSYAYVNPVVAVILGMSLAGETLDPWGWAGTVVIVGAVALITLTKR
jgi:drug/metabolite transporter (DMT)-like permease